MSISKVLPAVRGAPFWAIVFLAANMVAAPAPAALHLWNISEIYSNSSGTLQFIELHDPSGFQNFIGGGQITASNSGNTLSNTFTIPGSVVLPGDTLNHKLLFGTSGLNGAGGPVPDFIIPNNFLFTAGGSISFFGANSGLYGALPTNGTNALLWETGQIAVNSPTNFAGQSGTVVIPEPTTLTLAPLAAGIYGLYRVRLRRRVSSLAPVASP